MRYADVFSSFSNKNYRYYFTGQGISLIGTWMQTVAMGWLVYSLTRSSSKLGAYGFLNMIPSLIFGYLAGALSDRVEKKKALFWTQGAAMLSAFFLAYLTSSGKATYFAVLLIGFINGTAGAFDMPLRQSFTVEIVGKELLPNAIALNSIMFNSSRMIGPALGGFIIKYWGEKTCFWLNFVSYFFIMSALYKIKPYTVKKNKKSSSLLEDLKSGIIYMKNSQYISYPLIFLSFMSFVIMPVITLLPVYVSRLKGDAGTMGIFMSIIGLGAIISGLRMAGKKENKNMSKQIYSYSLLYAFSLAALSFSNHIWISALFLFTAGMGTARQAVGINTLIQSLVREDMRGRVVSVYALSFTALAPFGNMFWGWIGEKYGINYSIFAASLWALLANIWFIRKMYLFKKKNYLAGSDSKFYSNPELTKII